MEEFIIQGGSDFLKITFEAIFGFPETTGPFGGYDAKCIIEISSGNFRVKSTIYVSTGEIYEFYKKLVISNKTLKGDIHFTNYERDLDLNINYTYNGHVSITGKFSEHSEFDNLLNFDFLSDQSYIQSTIRQLQVITEKYGDMKGVK